MTIIKVPGYGYEVGLPADGAEAVIRRLDTARIDEALARLADARQRAAQAVTEAYARRQSTQALQDEIRRAAARTRMPMTQAAVERGRTR